VEEGRCEAALTLLVQISEAHPDAAEPWLARGRCEVRLRRYPEAVASLETAGQRDPGAPGVALPLAIARYHQGDLAGAATALDVAEAAEPDRAEVQLYRGLLLLARSDDAGAAAEHLARARTRDADAVEPIASYYEGLAWLEASEPERAGQAFERVIADWPGSEWAERAERGLEATQPLQRRRWARGEVGWQYDDNAVLVGEGVQLPAEISSERDTRVVWSLEAGAELWKTPDWTWGALLRYDGVAYQDLDDFDSHYPVLTSWLDRSLGEQRVLRFEADAGYAWVGGNPFLALQRYGVGLYQGFGGWGTSRVFARFGRYNFLFPNEDVPDGPGRRGAPCLDTSDILCAPPGIDEARERNRDGNESIAGLEHTLPLRWGTAWGGYRFHHYGTRGSEFSFNGHELSVGFRSALPFGFVLQAEGRYFLRNYNNASTFADPGDLFFNRQYGLSASQRRDDDFLSYLSLGYPVGEHALVEARWTYQRNRSNVDVFDYRRNIVGVHLTLHVGS
jgi:tetratricopeptide (TPR) repeat protein